MKQWEMFTNKSNKTKFESEFAKLLGDILSEGSAKIDNLTDEQLDIAKVVRDENTNSSKAG